MKKEQLIKESIEVQNKLVELGIYDEVLSEYYLQQMDTNTIIKCLEKSKKLLEKVGK